MNIRAAVFEMCKKNPKMWKNVALHCINEQDYDDIEYIAKQNGWKLPRESYLHHCSEIREDVTKFCDQSPERWEVLVRCSLKLMPLSFIEYLAETWNWDVDVFESVLA